MNIGLLANTTSVSKVLQPNEIDHKRIENALINRKRYRYVQPDVRKIDSGYQITSPCCSRNIDSTGGEIDIARIEYIPEQLNWRLFYKDHANGKWTVFADFPNLPSILLILQEDPDRRFWQ